MKKYLLVLGALSASYQLIAADIGAGKIEFEKKCVSCHGKNAERKALGISRVIANITSEKEILKLLSNIKKDGKKSEKNMAMVNAVINLSKQDFSNLAAYIVTLKKKR